MSSRDRAPLVVVHPAPSDPTLVPSGSSVGDQRFWFFQGETRRGGTVWIDWLMTTTASNGRGGGSERRISDAVFTFDRLNRNQIVLNGVADYAVGVSTFQPGTVATRAITGGTGRYDEVTGQVLSQRFDDGSWSQWFLIGDYDVIVGTDGDDRLKPGGSAPSSMTGLDGADRFVLAQRQRWQMNRRYDLITDFDGAQGDQLVLKTKAFPGLDAVRLARVRSRRELQRQSERASTLVMDERTGLLWLDLNGKAEGWGRFGGPVVALQPGAALKEDDVVLA
ncbi:MAG: hypothetical protein RLZZ106_1968 [Cyanobacteriota bacterium]